MGEFHEAKRPRLTKDEDKDEGADIPVRLPVVGVTDAEKNAPCARWSRILEDGNYKWDLSKLKCFLSQEERDDRLFVRNVIHGTILSGQVHPLIFDTACEDDHEMVRLRSLPFFQQLLADKEKGLSIYEDLNDEQKNIVAVGVRDLFLAARAELLDEEETSVLQNMIKLLDETQGCVEAMGMKLSFHPSTNFKVVKLVEDLDERGGAECAPLFAQVMQTPRLFMVFVDPVELSFHNLENIVPLDRWIENKPDPEKLSLHLDDSKQVQDGREVWACKLRGVGCDILKEASSLDLYVAPLNKATRGGERFIFHSALLSRALSEVILKSGLLEKLAKGKLASSFEFVNSVFRCNKFAAGNSMFPSHLDTPYYDSGRDHVSKYTLLIYLTAGQAHPALRVNDVALTEVEEMTCVIFDQSYEHEGRAFEKNEKVFIRSELVFHDTNLDHDSRISALFAEACYMSRHSACDDELTLYAHECFERANSLHWSIESKATEPPIYFQNNFHGLHFLTNGHNYWFPKCGGINVVDCALITVLDYFQCKVGGEPFSSMCSSSVVQKRFDKTDDVWNHLSAVNNEKGGSVRRLNDSDIPSLFKKCSDKPFVKRKWEGIDEDDDDEESNSDPCCPFHCWDTFDGWKDSTVTGIYSQCQYFTQKMLAGAPLLLLNQELVINESNVKIVGDKIYILQGPSAKPLAPINFAACWNGPTPSEFIDIDRNIDAPEFLLPPLIWHEFDQGYQLVLDFFRNDWMIHVDDNRRIPVPKINNDLKSPEPYDDEPKGPFLDKALPLWTEAGLNLPKMFPFGDDDFEPDEPDEEDSEEAEDEEEEEAGDLDEE